MSVQAELLPKKYHEAVLKWQRTYLADLDYLTANWDRYFPRDPCFQLCA